ncbi:MAG TPA: hypothetical protein VKQ08_12960 [Cyclobacteriaceae bacterium]|nr:hypothetical protein [Cyclobacteriaceae bacterium]
MTTAIEHFRNLVSLSAADGKIEEIERVARSKIAYERGIPMDRMNVMLSKANEYVYLIPQNLIDREKQLEEMIAFAKVDGEFSKSELDLISVVAGRLGFSVDQLDQFIKDGEKN